MCTMPCHLRQWPLYTTYMSKSETPVVFSHTFQANIDTINTHGGCAGRHPELVKEYVDRLMAERGLDHDSDVDEIKKVSTDAERQSCDEYLACLFILVADGGRYQGLKRALDNQYLMDKDAYPCTGPQALKLLEQFKPESTNEVIPAESGGDPGVAFTQTRGYQPTCYNFHAKGDTVNECPKLDEAGKDKFWTAFKSARKAKCERGTAHAAVAEVPAPAPTPT